MLLEVAFIFIQHAIQPREKLLRAVIGVENDGDAVCGSDFADVVSSGDGTGDRCFLVAIGDALIR